MFFYRYVLGQHRLSDRALPIRPDDIFVVSHFRSGNTWTRFLLGNLLNLDRPMSFASVEGMSPDIYQFRYRDFCKLPSPRLIKSHECFDPRYRRVIYIVRDPRDVAISLYHFLKKMRTIGDDVPLATYASEWFIQGKGSGVTWREHVGSWIANPKTLPVVSGLGRNRNCARELCLADLGACGHGRQVLVVRYEDLIADPIGGLSRMAEFLKVTASPQQIRSAVERSSASEMRKLEQKDKDKWFLTQGTRQDINFVREARSNQWRSTLPIEAVARIESTWGGIMQLLGYQLST
jgi:hypothetical protein